MEDKKLKVALVSFTDRGGRLNQRLAKELERKGYVCAGYEKRSRQKDRPDMGQGLLAVEESVSQWAGRRFMDADHIVFVGAMGIAVRSIAPWIGDKWTDPSVAVIDEAGRFVISVLSGHAGGGNDLAAEAAGILGAVPVITTATDINQLFAVDVFAVKNALWVTDRALAREISGEVLSGGKVGVFSDYPLEGPRPGELTWEQRQKRNFWVTRRRGSCPWKGPEEGVLKLVPKVVHVGVGCRKDTPEGVLEEALFQALERWDCVLESVAAIATIDLKKQEPGLLGLARGLGTCFRTYEARELAEVDGEFQESSFVAQVTGIGNVCERAALKSAGENGARGKLICGKQVISGVTIALAEETWKGTL